MKPMSMRDILKELCHRWGIERRLKEYEVMSKWAEVVGHRIADEAQPTGVERGKLFVRVESSAWRNELTFMKTDIITRLNRIVGTSVIHDIIFTGGKRTK